MELFDEPAPLLLRLRFWRAPPCRLGKHRGTRITLAVTDEHGAPTTADVSVSCCVAGAAASEVVPCQGAGPFWVATVSPEAVARVGDRVEIRAAADRWDVVGVRTGPLDVGDEGETLLQHVRDFRFGTIDACVVEDFGAACGGHVWNGAIVLSQYIVRAADNLKLAGRRALELGAGCGLASVVAAACGANVLATDREGGSLEVLRRNFHNVAALDFGDARLPPSCLPATLVFASDVLYACVLGVATPNCAQATSTVRFTCLFLLGTPHLAGPASPRRWPRCRDSRMLS